MKEYITLRDYVLEKEKEVKGTMVEPDDFEALVNRAKFDSLKPKIGMFLPCDLDCNVLENPENLKGFYETDREGMIAEEKARKEYQDAKERILFEGFEVNKLFDYRINITNGVFGLNYNSIRNIFWEINTLSDLSGEGLLLTDYAIEKYGV